MPGCVLRVSGVDFDVDSFLDSFPRWKPEIVFHKGEIYHKIKNIPHSTSGFTITTSDSESFETQIQESDVFLNTYSNEIKKLRELYGQTITMCLSFSKIYVMPTFPYALFPNTFVKRVADFDLDLGVGMFYE